MRFALLVASLALACPLSRALPTQGGGAHQDDLYGFKFQPPRGWGLIPLKVDEAWLVAKYLSDKTYVWTDKESGWSSEHKPELMVIAFLEEVIRKAYSAEEPTAEEAEPAESDEEVVIRTKPYKDYEDFLDRTYSGGGFYVSAREQTEVDKVLVTKYEVKVEKLTYSGPKRIVTWVFDAEGVDFAVQIEVLESSYEKLESSILSALRSFRLIPRTKGPLPTEAKVDTGWYISIRSMNEGTPEERRAKRLESEKRIHEQAISNLPKDWKHEFTKNFLILTHTDERYTERVAAHCDALLVWFEEKIGFIGEGEYVRKPVVRICASEDERNSMARGVRDSSSWSFSSNNEILTCKSDGGFLDYEIGSLNSDLFDVWLRDRGELLYLGLPSWIQTGLTDTIRGARLVKGELQFRDYLSELMAFRIAVAKGETIPVRELMQMTSSEFYQAGQAGTFTFDRWAQSNTFVRYLLSPEASRSKLTKNLFADYVKNLVAVLAEVEKENFKEGVASSKAPTTEEEEEELYRKRNTEWKSSEREKQIVQRTFSRTFGSWTDKDWNALEKAFLKFAE